MTYSPAYAREYRAKNLKKIQRRQKRWYAENRTHVKTKSNANRKTRIEKDSVAFRLATRAKNLKKQFGLSLADYDNMNIAQAGLCAICRKRETVKDSQGNVRPLAVDHCHRTGKIRGLLCSNCNWALGLVEDDILRLLSMIRYLETNNDARNN